MTKTKSTKRALLLSALSLLMCVSMLIGSTFAWFTDSATSGNNKIVAGKLDVDLLMADANGVYDSIAGDDAAIFGSDILWEPGKTQIVYLAVANNGNLDLKYNIALNVIDGGLIGSLEYAIIDGADATTNKITATSWEDVKAIANAQTGDVVAGTTVAAPNGAITVAEKTEYFALAVHMKEEADNKYQGKNVTIDITVLATQLASESDSFGNQYDANAEFDTIVYTAADLQSALAAGKNVVVGSNIAMTEGVVIPAGKTVAIDLAGHTLSYNSTTGAGDELIENNGTLTINDSVGTGKITYTATSASGTAAPSYASNTITNNGSLTVNGGTLENTTAGTAAYVVDNNANTSNATLIVNGGKLVQTQTTYSGAIRLYANNTAYTTKVNVNGGEIIGRRSIWIHLSSSNLQSVKPAELNVTGGTITSTDDSRNLAIYVFSYGDSFTGTKINITGGVIDGNIEFKDSAATGEAGSDIIHNETIGAFVLKNAELRGAVQNATKDAALNLGNSWQ